MPFEDVFDLDLGITEADLDALDRAAEKAQRRLDKSEKEYAKLRKQFERVESSNLKTDERIQKNLDRISAGIEKKQEKKKQHQKDVLQEGAAKVNEAIGFLQNPLNALKSVFATLPLLGGFMAAGEIALFIWQELAKIDAFFKKFVNIVDDRVNSLRDRQQEAQIRAGLTQTISTTQAGITDPRDAYNSYEEYHSDYESLQDRYATRTTSGVS